MQEINVTYDNFETEFFLTRSRLATIFGMPHLLYFA